MPASTPLRVILAKPRGFCAGVVRAVDIVERTLEAHGAPVYVRHEIVHNRHVVEDLRSRGAVFVDEVDAIPEGAVTIFSAHGVSRAVERAAADRRLDVIDATCPLVEKVHIQGRRYAERGYDVVLIGHHGHAEVEGTRGQIPGRLYLVGSVDEVAAIEPRDPERIAYVTQTTLALTDTRHIIAALKARFPAIVGPDTRDICYATQNRQNAVLALVGEVDLLVVIGSANSSNSNRLREIGEQAGIMSRLIDDAGGFDPAWLTGVARVGITAGASAPERLVEEVVERLAELAPITVETLAGIEETMQFRLPARLQPRVAVPA